MEEEYKETQKVISNKIIQGLIILILIILTFSIYKYSANKIELVLGILISALLLYFIFVSNLSLSIGENGVIMKYFPFHISPVIYKWEDIESLKIITYNPTRDFLGWGIRKGRFGRKVKCFTTHGNQALYMKLKDGRIRIIGTQQPKKIENFLKYNNNVISLSLLI